MALSSKEQHCQANVSTKEGKELFNKYLAKKMPAPTAETTTSKHKGKGKKSSETVTKRNLVKHHLGIWHGRGEVMLGWTSETTYHKTAIRGMSDDMNIVNDPRVSPSAIGVL